MPHNLLRAEELRLLIAKVAAEDSGKQPGYFLPLIGEILLSHQSGDRTAAPWRLGSFTGSPDDLKVIEQAAAATHRTCPLIAAASEAA